MSCLILNCSDPPWLCMALALPMVDEKNAEHGLILKLRKSDSDISWSPKGANERIGYVLLLWSHEEEDEVEE